MILMGNEVRRARARVRARGGVGSAAQSWSPSELTGLQIWLRPEELGDDQSLVSMWSDQSGNGNDLLQGTQTAQPKVVAGALDDQKAVLFDGVDDVLVASITGLFDSANGTIVVVCRQNSAQSINGLFVYQSGGTDTVDAYATWSDNTIYFDFGNQTSSTSGGRISNTPAGWEDAYHLLMLERESGTQRIIIDGSQVASAARSKTFTSAGAQNFHLGRVYQQIDPPATPRYFRGEIVEVIVLSGAMTDEEEADLIAYFDERYPSLGIA